MFWAIAVLEIPADTKEISRKRGKGWKEKLKMKQFYNTQYERKNISSQNTYFIAFPNIIYFYIKIIFIFLMLYHLRIYASLRAFGLVQNVFSCTDHVYIMHWSHDCSCTDHVDDHTLIMWQIMHWSRGWSCTDTVTEHGLITWLSCSDYVT